MAFRNATFEQANANVNHNHTINPRMNLNQFGAGGYAGYTVNVPMVADNYQNENTRNIAELGASEIAEKVVDLLTTNELFKATIQSAAGGVKLEPKLSKKDIVRNKFTISQRSHIVVVGTGGTGGYVIPQLCRMIYGLKDKGKDIKLTLIDPDKVEQKNLLRQNFIESDLDGYKAEVLAERYAAAFGSEIATYTEWCDEKILTNAYNAYPNHPMLIIGCVDNNKARRAIHKYLLAGASHKSYYSYSPVVAWIDSGNETKNGQVVVGTFHQSSKFYLPFVTDLYPDLLDEKKDPVKIENCAERAAQDIQNIFVNVTAATHILNFVNMIYSGDETSIHGVEFGINGASQPIFLKKGKKPNELDNKEGIWRIK